MPSLPPVDLHALARKALAERGFLTAFPEDARREAERAGEPRLDGPGLRDMTGKLWSSIDNDESRDLDQIESAEPDGEGVRLFVGIADVDALVPGGSAV